MTTSVLSAQSDGCGFFYGYLPGDYRQINVRRELADNKPVFLWHAYLAGELIGTAHSKDEAEAMAVEYAKAYPEPVRDEEE